MKKYTQSRMAIEYVLIAFSVYLLISLVISIIGDYNYREVLSSPAQMFGLFLIYWWLPIFRMVDIEEKNKGE